MKLADFGLIGLGVMGKNLALNIADKGFSLSVYNRSVSGEIGVANNFLKDNSTHNNILACHDLESFTLSLKRPRKIMLMIKSGDPIDNSLKELIPFLNKDDLIIDGGNSYFLDTMKRSELLKKYKIQYIGAGISGGEKGARNGPSIMPGGSIKSYSLVSNVLESIAAKDKNGSPCCSLIGSDGSGHFVKMVHNGIEYGEMQLLVELFNLMKEFMNYEEIANIFEEWNKDDLSGYLLDITYKIIRKKEKDKYLIDIILDSADNKGTGSWSSKIAFDLGVPATMMSVAVFARYISSFKNKRNTLSKKIGNSSNDFVQIDTVSLKKAYQFARIINHAQGFELIKKASDTYSWNLDLSEIARIWTNGCIIKSDLMNKLNSVFKMESDLLQNTFFFDLVKSNEASISKVIKYGIDKRVAFHSFGTALNYWIDITSKIVPANLIQAQRDYFGSHGYQRNDENTNKLFHTKWDD